MRKLDYDRSVSTQNARGEWVPSIPIPFQGFRKRCSCGRPFWTMVGYEGHYARDHILGLAIDAALAHHPGFLPHR